MEYFKLTKTYFICVFIAMSQKNFMNETRTCGIYRWMIYLLRLVNKKKVCLLHLLVQIKFINLPKEACDVYSKRLLIV